MIQFAAHTYVISLPRRQDRRASFAASAAHVGLERWSFWDAVDGRAQNLSAPHGTGGRGPGGAFTHGEVGCYLSHLAVVREAKRLDLESVAIFEDDVAFVGDLACSWGRFRASVPGDWRILHLVCPALSVRERRMPATRRPSQTGLACPADRVLGAYAYVLSRAGIDAFLAHPDIPRMGFPIDGVTRDLQCSGGYRPTRPLVRLINTSSDLGAA